MKKIISLILVAVLLLSFTACNNESNNDDNPSVQNEPETLQLDVEQLKYNWTDGIFTFANGNQVSVPCKLSQFVEMSGLVINNSKINSAQNLSPNTSKQVYLVGYDTYVSVECKNTTEETLNILETTVVEFSMSNVNSGNRNIKYVDTLTMGVGKDAVLAALGEPKDTAGDNTLYYYKGRNNKREKVELRISFNSDDIVNAVAFEIDV